MVADVYSIYIVYKEEQSTTWLNIFLSYILYTVWHSKHLNMNAIELNKYMVTVFKQ